MKTKNGIEFDLNLSKYVYKKDNFSFYFSSELYLKKFNEEVEDFVMFENTKINSKYRVHINLCLYLMIALYKRIEKRGFLIKYKDEVLNEVKFNSYLN